MPATTQERKRFRRKLNGTVDSMPDDYIDEVMDEALERYPETEYERIVAATYSYILGIRDLRGASAGMTDYDQNDTADKRSQLPAHLEKLEKSYLADLDDLLGSDAADGAVELPPVMWGGTNRVPPPDQEFPA
jgi:hypothetical protein